MGSVMVIVHRNPCDFNHEAYQVGFMDEGFDTGILKDIRFGLSTEEFCRLIGLMPNQALRSFQNRDASKKKLSCWLKKLLSRRHSSSMGQPLGLSLTEEEFQWLANLVGFPVLRYNYDRKGNGVVQFIARTDPD